ncbi:MAG: ABC transporter ATP-binding protein [Phycisphaerales bacterium]|nr:ABC transporter ATP-binding protein [Phycisphaerales bacterium]
MVSGQSNNIIEAVGLSKVFNDFWFRAKARAVDGVDLEVRQGEVLGLLGPNGSGKSTTIKLILGLLKKTQGKLAVFGKDPSHVSIKKRIGYLPEETYMYRFLDARETLDYYGKLFGLDHRIRKRRVDELLDMVGLGQVAHRKVGEYSKGMARRIGIAQALINDPDLLILDEPTSGLDPLGTRQVKELIEQLGRKGTTILLSSHLLSDVEDVCDRMVILYGGKIRAEGTAKELLADSEHTVIKIPKISDQAISAVESTLERTAGVHIESVESPRQRLEDFFMGIVESARAEQAATSGAAESGPTAAFLREEGAAGEDLIDVLSSDQAEDSPIAVERARKTDSESRSESRERDDKVLDELMGSSTDDKPKTKSPTPLPKVDESVDSGFIDDLLGDADDERKE